MIKENPANTKHTRLKAVSASSLEIFMAFAECVGMIKISHWILARGLSITANGFECCTIISVPVDFLKFISSDADCKCHSTGMALYQADNDLPVYEPLTHRLSALMTALNLSHKCY